MTSKESVKGQSGSTWWDRNKKRVKIAGGIAVAIAGGWLLCSNWSTAKAVARKVVVGLKEGRGATTTLTAGMAPVVMMVDMEPTDASERPRKLINGGDPFPVSGHVRNLPSERTSSVANRMLAAANGVTLEKGQSYIPTYMKNVA
ncbi:MAG: hypothetical protein IKG22_00935 [Atopobiaceae bacterium]|nr:hypothetical protein [Atopobiaceae bacterium]